MTQAAPLVIAQYDIKTADHTRHGFNVSNLNHRTSLRHQNRSTALREMARLFL